MQIDTTRNRITLKSELNLIAKICTYILDKILYRHNRIFSSIVKTR